MTKRGEYAWHPPGIYRVVYARQDGSRIGPTHRTLEEAQICSAPCERRINLRSIRTLHDIRYIVGASGEAIVLVEAEALTTEPERPKYSAHRSKLTADQVREIRARADAGEVYHALARFYPVSGAAIGQLVRRETYGWVT